MYTHKLLIPDLPSAAQLHPWLEKIDANRHYSNFGPLVKQLESGLGDWLSELSGATVMTQTLSSGTSALELALAAMDLPPGARVLVPALTFPATALGVIRAGCRPVMADVDPGTWALTPELARRTESDAVVTVATYGVAQDVDAWDAFVRETGRPVLIDAAAAMGFQRVGRHVPVVFSLHATKPFGCGEGGLLAAQDHALLEKVRQMSNFGFHAWRTEMPGTNAKMSEYAAAVALAQLERRQHILKERHRIWACYRDRLQDMPGVHMQVGTQTQPPAVMCVDLTQDASRVQQRLFEVGVETRRWYCPPLYAHPALASYAGDGAWPVSDRLGEQLLGLPFHHFLSNEDIAAVASTLKKVLDHEQAS